VFSYRDFPYCAFTVLKTDNVFGIKTEMCGDLLVNKRVCSEINKELRRLSQRVTLVSYGNVRMFPTSRLVRTLGQSVLRF